MRRFLGSALAVVFVGVLISGCAARRSGALPTRGSASTGATVESTDKRLAAALLADAIRPSAEGHLQVAREYARLGILDAAHSRAERALALEPQFAAAQELMARIWRDWGLPDAGLPYAHRAVRLDPESASAVNTLGTILDSLGRIDEARRAYARALTMKPDAGWALNNLCYLEFRVGNLAAAQRHCEAAVRATPAVRVAHNNLGLTYAASGDMRRANAAFRDGGDEAAAHFNVGMVHLANRRFVEAALAFESAIRIRPEFTAAKTRAHEARMRALTR